MQFGVLGPLTAAYADGEPVGLRGPRHRSVLARLLAARGRVVPLAMLVEDLWEDPPPGAVGAIRTFVGELRRALEPSRPPRAPARLLVTEGLGYALRAAPETVDALRFERAVESASSLTPDKALPALDEALNWWRGPAYADFLDADWSRAERTRLTQSRLLAVERQAAARLDLGLPEVAVPDLDAHVAEHPWREEGWRLLALALYRSGRQGDALAALARARTLLVEELGLDPGPALRTLETDILHQSESLTAPPVAPATVSSAPEAAAARVWAAAADTYDRTVGSGARARLRSTVDLLRSLAVTGGSGLEAARQQRLATVQAAEELGEVELTARVIGAYDVPAIWSRSDDLEQATEIVAAAERTLQTLPGTASDLTRARLLATIAVESRGGRETRPREAAAEAERLARRLDDPALLAFALNGTFMQSFDRTGQSSRRDGIGAELVDLSARHGLVTYEVLGHLVRLQARSAVGDLAGADRHAAAADRLAESYESPLVGVFTGWYAALRLALTDQPVSVVEDAYRKAAARLDGAGMPGLERGLLPLALLALRVQHDLAVPHQETDWGPYAPWARPLVLLARGQRSDAVAALRAVPEPPADHLAEAWWCLVARAAITLQDSQTMERAHAALAPAAGEIAGAGSGLFSLGPVSRYLDELAAGLRR